MVPYFLLLLVGGIGLAQAASAPRQVTLQWLRLGGLIGLALLTVTAATAAGQEHAATAVWTAAAVAAIPVAGQLLLAQLGRHRPQRWLAGLAYLAACGGALAILLQHLWLAQEIGGGPLASYHQRTAGQPVDLPLSVFVSSGLLGGLLMTMLLGHAYLTAGGRMTQAPLARLVLLVAALLAARAGLSVWHGLIPHLGDEVAGAGRVWTLAMVTVRYLVGLGVPAVFLWMVYDCVKRRSNQSATGILYVTVVLVIVGEGTALALLAGTGRVF